MDLLLASPANLGACPPWGSCREYLAWQLALPREDFLDRLRPALRLLLAGEEPSLGSALTDLGSGRVVARRWGLGGLLYTLHLPGQIGPGGVGGVRPLAGSLLLLVVERSVVFCVSVEGGEEGELVV